MVWDVFHRGGADWPEISNKVLWRSHCHTAYFCGFGTFVIGVGRAMRNRVLWRLPRDVELM